MHYVAAPRSRGISRAAFRSAAHDDQVTETTVTDSGSGGASWVDVPNARPQQRMPPTPRPVAVPLGDTRGKAPSAPEPTFSLSYYAALFRRRLWLMAVFVVLFVIAGLTWHALSPTSYTAETQLLVQLNPVNQLLGGSAPASDPARAVDTAIGVLESAEVQDAVEQAHPDAASVHGVSTGSTDILTARVTSSSQDEAVELADAYASAFIDVRRQQEAGPYLQAADAVRAQLESTTNSIAVLDSAVAAAPPEQQAAVAASQTAERQALASLQSTYSERLDQYQVAAVSATGGATVVEAASVEDSSSKPSPVKVGVVAGALGLIVGIGVIVFWDLADDRIRRGVDVEAAGIWPLGVIPRVKPRRSRPGPEISAPTRDLRSGTVRTREAFRALRGVVESAQTHSGASVLLVVGPRSGVGASTVAENLALALSEVGHSCVFVDVDPRTTESGSTTRNKVDIARTGEGHGARRRLFTYGGGAPDETALLSPERPGRRWSSRSSGCSETVDRSVDGVRRCVRSAVLALRVRDRQQPSPRHQCRSHGSRPGDARGDHGRRRREDPST